MIKKIEEINLNIRVAKFREKIQIAREGRRILNKKRKEETTKIKEAISNGTIELTLNRLVREAGATGYLGMTIEEHKANNFKAIKDFYKAKEKLDKPFKWEPEETKTLV